MTAGVSHSVLFEPTTIRGMELCPTASCARPPGRGWPTTRVAPTQSSSVYAELARGRVGLIISSHAFVSAEGKAVDRSNWAPMTTP